MKYKEPGRRKLNRQTSRQWVKHEELYSDQASKLEPVASFGPERWTAQLVGLQAARIGIQGVLSHSRPDVSSNRCHPLVEIYKAC